MSLWVGGLRRRKLAMVSFVIIVLYFLLAGLIYVGEICNWQWTAVKWSQSVGKQYQPPGGEHIFGTDIFGQSVFRKTLYGTKISLSLGYYRFLP